MVPNLLNIYDNITFCMAGLFQNLRLSDQLNYVIPQTQA